MPQAKTSSPPVRRIPLWRVFRSHRAASRSLRLLLIVIAIGGLAPLVLTSSTGCERAATPARTGTLRIVVTIAPLAGLMRELAPPDAKIETLMPPGRSEHGYEFTPRDIAKLGAADVVVSVGLGLEPQITAFLDARAGSASSAHTSAVTLGIALRLQQPGVSMPPHTHDHDEGGSTDTPAPAEVTSASQPDSDSHGHVHDESCEHGPVDPHVWLDPALVLQTVPALKTAIREALERRGTWNSDAHARLDSAESRLNARIAALDQRFRDALAPFAGRAIVTHHAAFGRLAERYGLRIAEVIHHADNAEPSPGQLAAVTAALTRERVGVIFVEPQFNPQAAQRLAQAAGVRVGRLDPLGDGDWFAMMESNLAALQAGLAAAPPPAVPAAPPASATSSPDAPTLPPSSVGKHPGAHP